MEVKIRRENQALFDARPRYWEPLLAVDQLERPLQELTSPDHPLAAVAASPVLSRLASAEFVLQRIRAFQIAIEGLQSALEKDLTASFGEPGQPGDPLAIMASCGLILAHCRTLAQAESEILRTPLHPDFHGLQNRFSGLAAENIGQIRGIVAQMRDAAERERTGTINLQANFSTERLAGLTLGAGFFLPETQTILESKEKSDSGCGGCLGLAGIILVVGVLAIIAPWWAIVIFLGLCLIASGK